MEDLQQFICIRPVFLQEYGLKIMEVIIVSSTNNQESHVRLDAHKEESTARMCAARWSEFYGLPVKMHPYYSKEVIVESTQVN